MGNLPLVSVLAVSYNHAEFVIETLESIRKQTYANIQLVILDDCSTDNTVELINAWIKEYNVACTFIAHTENKGVCKTYNEGVGLCKGKYYSTVSCDDILALDKTVKQVEFFEKQGDTVGMVYSDAEIFDKRKSNTGLFIELYRKDGSKPSGEIFEELITGNFIPAMSVLVRKDVFDELGGFDEELIFEDYDFFLRLARKYKVLFLDEKCVKYRVHGDNLHLKMHQIGGYNQTMGQIYLKHFEYSQVAKKKLYDSFNLLDQLKSLPEVISKLNRSHHQVILSWRYRIGNLAFKLLGVVIPKFRKDLNNERFIEAFLKSVPDQ